MRDGVGGWFEKTISLDHWEVKGNGSANNAQSLGRRLTQHQLDCFHLTFTIGSIIVIVEMIVGTAPEQQLVGVYEVCVMIAISADILLGPPLVDA